MRSLSRLSPIYLCREHASGRLLVVKLKSHEASEAYQREIRALLELETCPFSPKLLFALEQPEALCMGIQYCPGKSLLQLKEQNGANLSGLPQALRSCLTRIHLDFGYSHGDLSPQNILVQEGSCNDKWKITLVDWEYSEKLSTQTVSSYSQYRGTIGFSGKVEAAAIPLRDQKALEACIEFLGIKGSTSPKNHDPGSPDQMTEKSRTFLRKYFSWN